MNTKTFGKILILWWEENKRDLPWKNTKDPYKIWLSEIILQQTRVDQGTPYYNRFIQTYPTIKTLADAAEDDVLKLWEGLGYYSRARNLHHTAKEVAYKHQNIFPSTLTDIKQLKGIGPYTATAIASYAFDLPYGVVDGNVLRVVSRVWGIYSPVDKKDTHAQIQDIVNTAVKNRSSADFNQAMMDFGASICLAKNPKCIYCPFTDYCIAYKESTVAMLPIKSPKSKRKERFFHYFDIQIGECDTIIKQREENDIWKKLYEFPLFESDSANIPSVADIETTLSPIIEKQSLKHFDIVKLYTTSQLLTHRKIYGHFYRLTIPLDIYKPSVAYKKIKVKDKTNFAFPKLILQYFDYLEIR